MLSKTQKRLMSKAQQAISMDYEDFRDHTKDNAKYISRVNVINMMTNIKTESGLNLVDEINLVQQIVVSDLSDKLDGFAAVSTSCLMNERCRQRAKNPELICFWCYAMSGATRYTGLMLSLETNYRILNDFLLSDEALATLAIPTTNGASRIEAHGDVASVTCARNYIRIIRTHKWIHFGVWSKNADIWKKAFDLEGKPGNMTFILSSLKVNEVVKVADEVKQYVDKVFTVYSKEYAKEHDIVINCGTYEGTHPVDAACKNCMRCYIKGESTFYINEILK